MKAKTTALSPKINQPKMNVHFFPLSEFVAQIDHRYCDRCFTCRDVCVREVIDEQLSFTYVQCSGCGTCLLACPSKAIKMVRREGTT